MKILVSFFLVLFVNHVIANDEVGSTSCTSVNELKQFLNIETLEKYLEWHGASNSNIEMAPCKNLSTLTNDEMTSFNLKKGQEVKTSASALVNGVAFSNESPILISAFNKLTTTLDSFGLYKKPELQKNFQKEFKINPECKKVICAVNKIWGVDLGPKILYVFLKHSFISSEYAFQNSDRFTKEELEDVVMGLEDLPKAYTPLGGNNKRLTHFSRGMKLYNDKDETEANAVVMLFDGWSNQPRLHRQYAIFHELSHNIAFKLNRIDESPSWLKLSSWVKKGDDWAKDENACFASRYSLANPWEDYAEAVSSYRYNGKTFKESCPGKYNFIKENVFKGKEYVSQSSCSDFPKEKLQMILSELSPQLARELEKLNIDEDLVKERCKGSLSYPLSDSESQNCAESLVKVQLEKADESLFKVALIKNNLPTDSATISQLKLSIANDIASNSNLGLQTKVSVVENMLFDQIIKNNLPQKRDGQILNMQMSPSLPFEVKRNCRSEIWSTDHVKRRRCLSAFIVNQDRERTTFLESKYFKKLVLPDGLSEDSALKIKNQFYTEVENSLVETDVLDDVINAASRDTKQAMRNHFKSASYYLDLNSGNLDFKKLSPKEFCQKYYNNPNEYIQTDVLPKGSREIPGFEIWCEGRQEQSKKRFSFSEKDISEWLDLSIK